MGNMDMKSIIKIMAMLTVLSVLLFTVSCRVSTADVEEDDTIISTSEEDKTGKAEKEKEPGNLIEDIAEVRFDGLYCYIYDSDGDGLLENKVLRFYGDGSLISSTVAQTANGGYFPKPNWFNKESGHFTGYDSTYRLSGNKIVITTVSEAGTVDYNGEVFDTYMILNSHSNINGHEENGVVYNFFPFADLKDWNAEE